MAPTPLHPSVAVAARLAVLVAVALLVGDGGGSTGVRGAAAISYAFENDNMALHGFVTDADPCSKVVSQTSGSGLSATVCINSTRAPAGSFFANCTLPVMSVAATRSKEGLSWSWR